mgnify:CR=1 FL=1
MKKCENEIEYKDQLIVKIMRARSRKNKCAFVRIICALTCACAYYMYIKNIYTIKNLAKVKKIRQVHKHIKKWYKIKVILPKTTMLRFCSNFINSFHLDRTEVY